MPLQLLDLPEEILLMCLSHMALPDIAACLQLCNSALTRLIREAPAIQFRLELTGYAVEETAYGHVGPLFKRRKALKEREERWRTFAPGHRWVVTTRDTPALYDVGEDCYALAYKADPQTMLGVGMEYIFLNEEPVWLQPADITEPVWDICLVSEWDLLVVVTLSVENAGVRTMAAHLRQLSTGAVQEGLARTIDLAKVPQVYGVPHIRVEVAGSTLAIACRFPFNILGTRDQDLLHLIHWPSGRAFAAVPCSVTGFVFVHDTLLLLPNPQTHCLDVLALKPGLDGNLNSYCWILSFCLPALRVGHRIRWDTFDCRGQPNPSTHSFDRCTTLAQTCSPFRSKPERTPIFLMFDTATTPTDADVELSHTVVVIDRARLQGRFLENYQHPGKGAPVRKVPFAYWGLRASTWLDVGPGGLNLSAYAVTGFLGTRFAGLGSNHVRILDFNQTSVARVCKQIKATRTDVLAATHATIRVQPPATGGATQEDSVFAERLGAALGYVETTSREAVAWESVHLSNACILGEKDSDVEGERELHVLHFG
ncbi:hypothetical protein MIND_00199300 [Mycena indigotica]|uniref:F-box domain-containing protein n=1 Tax=Mycena indigotica TaxID=2126181 RepID=A0A8H6T6V8_9AGAR|nr:uncharacterized protein MIND_00199300 [Mycena indigotica]KAF7311884.1 hypothetical protein MIND_00199300 [Mycena indigotica]